MGRWNTKRRFPFARPGGAPVVAWRIVWTHPRGRFVMIEYRVQAKMTGGLSVPVRECFRTLPYGMQYLHGELKRKPTEKA